MALLPFHTSVEMVRVLRWALAVLPVVAVLFAVAFVVHMEQFERSQFQRAVGQLARQLQELQMQEEELSNKTAAMMELRVANSNERNRMLAIMLAEAEAFRSLLDQQRQADANLTRAYLVMQNVTMHLEQMRLEEVRLCAGRKGKAVTPELQHMRDLVMLGQTEVEEIANRIPRKDRSPKPASVQSAVAPHTVAKITPKKGVPKVSGKYTSPPRTTVSGADDSTDRATVTSRPKRAVPVPTAGIVKKADATKGPAPLPMPPSTTAVPPTLDDDAAAEEAEVAAVPASPIKHSRGGAPPHHAFNSGEVRGKLGDESQSPNRATP